MSSWSNPTTDKDGWSLPAVMGTERREDYLVSWLFSFLFFAFFSVLLPTATRSLRKCFLFSDRALAFSSSSIRSASPSHPARACPQPHAPHETPHTEQKKKKKHTKKKTTRNDDSKNPETTPTSLALSSRKRGLLPAWPSTLSLSSPPSNCWQTPDWHWRKVTLMCLQTRTDTELSRQREKERPGEAETNADLFSVELNSCMSICLSVRM